MRVTGQGHYEVKRDVEALSVLFGDKDAIAALSKRITDATAKADERHSAIELLLTRKQPGFAKTLRDLLTDPAVRQSAIRGLAVFPADAETPAAILKAYPQFTTEEKLDAVNTLAARTAWASALLDAIAKGTIPRSDVPVATARQILALNDKTLSARLGTVWGKIGSASKERAALMKKWKAALDEVPSPRPTRVAAGRCSPSTAPHATRCSARGRRLARN